jgi:hypothetical protein
MIDKKVPSWYSIPVSLSEDEKVNGYQLLNLNEEYGKPFYWYNDFQNMENHYNTPNTMTKEEFMEKYDEEACSEWSKMDENGECYGGFYNYPKDSDEYKNAYDLTRKANGEALYNLPYSHALIFETIRIGCNSLQESVKYSNTICEYVKRKLCNYKLELFKYEDWDFDEFISFLPNSCPSKMTNFILSKHLITDFPLKNEIKKTRPQSTIPVFEWKQIQKQKKQKNRRINQNIPKNLHNVKPRKLFHQ